MALKVLSCFNDESTMKDSFKIFAATIIIVYERALPIFMAVIIPVILLAALTIFESLGNESELGGGGALTFMLAIVFVLVNLALNIYIAISVHRIVLLGSDSVPRWGIKAWTNRESTFFYYSIGFAIIIIIFTVISSISGHWIGLLLALAFGLIITARLSLVLPACAVDKNMSLSESFDLTKNKTIFMVMAMYIWPIISLVPLFFFLWLINQIGEGIGGTASELIYDLFSSLIVILAIASLSLAYLHIVGKDRSLNV